MSRKHRGSDRVGAFFSDAPTSALTLRKKLCFGGLITTLVLGGCELVLGLLGVEPAFQQEDPYAGFSRHIPHFVEVPDEAGTRILTVSASKAEVLNPLALTAKKRQGALRIVCFGGSTTYGRPFYDLTSFPGWLRALLPAIQPDTQWEVVNAGAISYASYRVLGVMKELSRYEPDVFIVYTGQNEFLERRTYEQLSSRGNWLSGPMSLAFRTRTATVVRSILDSAGVPRLVSSHRAPILGAETRAIPVDVIGPGAYSRNDSLARDVVDHFESTLQQMVRVARECNAEIVFVVPASNIADFAPFRSEHNQTLSAEGKQQCLQMESRVRQLMTEGQFDVALSQVEDAVKIDDRHAGLLFLQGRLLETLGRFEEAKVAFRKACDEDVCPLRAISPLVETVRRVADSCQCSCVDFEEIVQQHAEHGLAGDDLFHDHVHPTIEANKILALSILEELHRGGIVSRRVAPDDGVVQDVSASIEQQIDRPLYAKQLRLLSTMLASVGQPAEFVSRQAEQSLKLSGRTSSALVELASGLSRFGAWSVALPYLKEAAERQPDAPQVRLQLAEAALHAGDSQLAADQLGIALGLNPTDAESLVRIGVLLAGQGLLNHAESALRKAAGIDPQSDAILNNLGLVLARQGQLEEAVQLYERALSLKPDSVSTHHNAGLAFEALGNLRMARLHYESAIRCGGPDGHPPSVAQLRNLGAP